MVQVRFYLLLLIIGVNFDQVYSISDDDVDVTTDDSNVEDDIYDDDDGTDDHIQYVYDNYYEGELKPKHQFRDCMDHRKYCYSLRHLCPNNNNENENNYNINNSNKKYKEPYLHIDDTYNTNDDNDEHSVHHRKVVRWMVSHCPYTCQACYTHQVFYHVPYEHTMKHEIEQKVRYLPNDHNLYSKINPNVWVENIRDAMTGKSTSIASAVTTSLSSNDTHDDNTAAIYSSSDAIGIQYLMSTTTKLQNRVSYEQRNAMIQQIHQTQLYYTTTVLPMLQTKTNSTHNMKCQNQSPYCTYWAVVYDRCQDPFYHFVMSQHCPVTCQLCHQIQDSDTISTNTTNHSNYATNDTIATSATAVTKNDEAKEDISTTTIQQEASTTMDDNSGYVFDSENCIYDPTSMPDIWYPHTYSVNQMFIRITTLNSNINITILSQPLLRNATIIESEGLKDSMLNTGNDNQQPPWLIQIDNFLSDTECEHLIQVGTSLGYERSTGLDYSQQQQLTNQIHKEHTVVSDERTSSTTWCHHSDCSNKDAIIQSIYHRIQNLIQIPSSHYESLQLLQYQMGQYYKSHHDYIPTQRRKYFGPRIITLLMYLSDVEEGGATHFPFLNITVQPKRGRIVLWSNVLHTQPNVMDLRMIHTALPVKQGVKFASNLWIHQREMYPSSCYVTQEEFDYVDEEVDDDEEEIDNE